jgi:hypothetical protein
LIRRGSLVRVQSCPPSKTKRQAVFKSGFKLLDNCIQGKKTNSFESVLVARPKLSKERKDLEYNFPPRANGEWQMVNALVPAGDEGRDKLR